MQAKPILGLETEAHFHATSHAKGRQDGFGSSFKSVLANEVSRTGALLNTKARVVNFMQAKYGVVPVQKANHLLWRHVSAPDRLGNRADRGHRTYSGIAGARDIHFIKSGSDNVGAGSSVIEAEWAGWSPCRCTEDPCPYAEWAPTLNRTNMQKETGKNRVTRTDFYDNVGRVSDLVMDGSILVIEAGDENEDYYMVRAIGIPMATNERVKIGGEWVEAGTDIVRGHWFVEERNGSRLYRLDEKKVVAVSRNSIRMIVGDLDLVKRGRKELFHVNSQKHEEIMGSLV